MSEIDPETLLPNEQMRQGVLDGRVEQIHRGHAYAEEGDTFEIDGITFEVVTVKDRTLGDLTEGDARAEGMEDLDQYRQLLERTHENFKWNDDSEVVLHSFERSK